VLLQFVKSNLQLELGTKLIQILQFSKVLEVGDTNSEKLIIVEDKQMIF
jgi:hypothetical protein